MSVREQALEYLRRPYARVIVPDEDGLYSAQIMEFPGCFSDGESPEEAYANLEEAAKNWLESALEQGMAIPPPLAEAEYSGTVSLRLPRSYHRMASEVARTEGVSLNQFLVTAIGARLGVEDFAMRLLAMVQMTVQAASAPTARTFVTQSITFPVDMQVTGTPPVSIEVVGSQPEHRSSLQEGEAVVPWRLVADQPAKYVATVDALKEGAEG